MTKPRIAQPPVPIEAIKNVVEYLYDNECQHYADFCDEDGNLVDNDGADHIFLSVEELADWLEALPGITIRAA